MFFLRRKYKIRENVSLGLLFFFILFSSLLITNTTFTLYTHAFINQNILGLYSTNLPGIISPVSPQIGSSYSNFGPSYGGGGYGVQSFDTGLIGLLPQVLGLNTGYGIVTSYGSGYGGYGGQSFATGLIGLLPQVLGGGIGSLFGQGSTSGYEMGEYYGYDSSYGSGFQSGNDEGFSEFETTNDPFDLGGDYNEGQGFSIDDSESFSNTPVEDLRSLDSPSDDAFFSNEGDDFSQSPFEDLRSLDSPSDDAFFSNEGDDFSQSPFEDLFG
jgi:hypothetical protein